MPIDVAILATTVVTSFLMPYIKLGGQKIGEKIAEKMGEATADHVSDITKRVWDRVKSVFSSEREQHILAEFEDEPEDTKPVIEAKLKKKLEQDSTLAKDLHELINSPGPDGVSTGAQIMNAHIAGILDARGANFSGASGIKLAGVMMEQPSSPKKEGE